MTRKERLIAALLLSFVLWCVNAHFEGREAMAEKIRIAKFEEEFYPAVATIEEMHEGLEDYKGEINSWGRLSTDGRKRRESSLR